MILTRLFLLFAEFKKVFRAPLFLLLILFPFSGAQAAQIDYAYRGVCPTPAGGRYSYADIDRWGFYKCECTSYVAAMLARDNVQLNGFPFNNATQSIGCDGTYCELAPENWTGR